MSSAGRGSGACGLLQGFDTYQRFYSGFHLAEASNLKRELHSVGIYARTQPQGMRSFEGVEIPPLPEKPSVLTMLPAQRFEFYGGNEVLEMAAAAPDIRWLIVANDGKGLPNMPNVEYLGTLRDMDSVFRRTTVLVRLTKHDGLSKIVLEALAKGRYVVWSHPMPHCRLARTADAALREVRAAIALDSPNLQGAAYVRKEFDVRSHAQRLCTIYERLATRYCVTR